MAELKYKLDRKKFIEYYPLQVLAKIDYDQVRNDLIKGSEFILTAQDILDDMVYVEGSLVGQENPVFACDCELTYNQ